MSKNGIFYNEAPFYWQAGLPVIPLLEKQKRPAVRSWQQYSTEMPSEDERRVWLDNFPTGNIGLPLGACSGLVAVDIDTDDTQIIRLLDMLLPKSPWRRVGKKGEVRIFRYRGERSIRIGNRDGMICEILSSGTQIVLPPSIHPDTGAAYRANAPLWEVFKAAPELPIGVDEMIRTGLRDAGIDLSRDRIGVVNFVPAGMRDNELTSKAGLFARAVWEGSRTLLEALGEIEQWVNDYTEKVIGDEMSVEKAKRKLIEFLIRDVNGVMQRVLPRGWDDGLTDEDKEKMGLGFSDEQQAMTVREIMDAFITDIAGGEDANSDVFNDAVNRVLNRMTRMGEDLTPLDEERILKVIASHSKGLYSVSGMRKQIRTLKKGDIAGENHDEIAGAVKSRLEEFGEIRFAAGKFWQWNGAYWREKEYDEIHQIVSTEFGNLPACRKNSDYSQIVTLLSKLLRADLKRIEYLGINFANGFLTEDLDLVPHHPDFGQTYVLSYRYMPDLAGKMPKFRQFMLDSWKGDRGKEDAIQEAIGATMFGTGSKYQRVICLYGKGGSGKSVMSQIVQNLIPLESQCSVPPEDWRDKFAPAQMFGKTLNFAGELSATRSIPDSHFKTMTGNEQITAQFKYRDPFMFTPACIHWFNSNHLPKSSDFSEGFMRRWLFIEWEDKVPEDKKIPGLAHIITDEEREAIVAWAVQGYERLKANNEYTLPTSHRRLVDEMANSINSARYFLASSPRLKFDRQGEATLMDLYNEFLSFCIVAGIAKRVPLNTFAKMMQELRSDFNFLTVIRTAKMGAMETVYSGITIAT